ncbi:MAG TPA: hypothetical protein VNF71_14500 [Acidimicrobiales bacterium]|nr:hypothetical protein [Acidimicrobiales bacterium]
MRGADAVLDAAPITDPTAGLVTESLSVSLSLAIGESVDHLRVRVPQRDRGRIGR